MGAAGAGLRVYINIGSCPDYRYSLEEHLREFCDHFRCCRCTGPTTQHPFDLNKAQRDCVDWQLTSARITNAAAFLDTVQTYPLKNAEGGTAYLNADPATMDLGKRAFAENCARCHSSKVPEEVKHGLDKHSEAAKPA